MSTTGRIEYDRERRRRKQAAKARRKWKSGGKAATKTRREWSKEGKWWPGRLGSGCQRQTRKGGCTLREKGALIHRERDRGRRQKQKRRYVPWGEPCGWERRHRAPQQHQKRIKKKRKRQMDEPHTSSLSCRHALALLLCPCFLFLAAKPSVAHPEEVDECLRWRRWRGACARPGITPTPTYTPPPTCPQPTPTAPSFPSPRTRTRTCRKGKGPGR